MKLLIVTAIAMALAAPAAARNTPCSGKKGGVSHCNGKLFICKDGSASQSKRSCGGR